MVPTRRTRSYRRAGTFLWSEPSHSGYKHRSTGGFEMSAKRWFLMTATCGIAAAMLLGTACVPTADTPAGDGVPSGEGVPGVPTDGVTPTDTTENPSGDQDLLAGSEWRLISYGPEGEMAEVPDDMQVTIRFDADQLGGTAACNSYFGSYRVEGETLDVGAIGMTEMWCEGLMELESTYLDMLGTVAQFSLTADELVLETANGLLVFGQAEAAMEVSITRTVWVLDTIVSGGTAQSVLAGTRITLVLSEGMATGEAGCNSFGAQYTLDGTTFSIGPAAMTAQDCGDEIMAQEALFMSMLGAASGLRSEGGRLVLDAPDGELVFVPGEKAELEGTVWVLHGIAKEDAIVETWVDAEITAEFAAGQVTGKSGCNSYSAGYQLDGSAITLGPAISTLMACEEERMAREDEYLAALAEVAGYGIELDQLTVSDAEGKTLMVFKPAEEQSLEGNTWVLQGITQEGGVVSSWVDAEITAEFASGQLTGNAGCNRYFASYETDGDALQVGPVGRTEMACVDEERMAREEAFLAALEAVVGYQIKMDVLTLLDSQGSPLLTLTATGK